MSSLGGFLFGNIDEEGKLDNEDFDEELRANLTTFSERIHDKKLFGLDDTLLIVDGEIINQAESRLSAEQQPTQPTRTQIGRAAVGGVSLVPLPDAVDFEDITEMAAEDSTNRGVHLNEREKEWKPTSPMMSIQASQLINSVNNENEEAQVVPFDARQILKFTRLSAKPELLNATGRSYSRYSSLRKIRIKRKHLHNKHVHLSENQLEAFLTRYGSVFGTLSPAAARLRLSLVHLNTTSSTTSNTAAITRPKRAWFQSTRYHEFERILSQEKATDTSTFEIHYNPTNVPVDIPGNSHFHPISLLDWENKIIWTQDDQESRGKEERSNGMFISFKSQNTTSTPMTTANRPIVASHPQSQSNSSLSSILSSLSLSGSGLGGDSATATALLALIRNQQMRSASISTGSMSSVRTPPNSYSRSSVTALLPRALKYPKSSAARILNRSLQDGAWIDSIMWDVQNIDPALLSTHLILPLDDPSLIFTPLPVENLSKKLSRAEKLIAKRLKKIRSDGSGNGLITSYSKSIADKFNLSNDKYYEISANSEQSASNTTGANIGGSDSATKSLNLNSGSNLNTTTNANTSSVSSSISATQLGLASSVPALQHAIPALKLSPPAFQTCRTKGELRLWHRPRFAFPPGFRISNWTRVRAPVKKSSSTTTHHQLTSTEICGDLKLTLSINPNGGIIRSAKKLTIKDSSRFVLLEYCEEFPSLLMNSGMGTYIVLYYRKKSPHDTYVPLSSFAHVHVLAFTDPSPFWMFGDIPAGASRYAICNGLFRAPLFMHKPSNCDFIIGRKADDSVNDNENYSNSANEFFLRPLEAAPTFLVGQEFPVAEVPGPHSRRHNMFCRQRLQVAAYRLFNKDLLVNNNSRKRLKIGRLLAAFPQFSEGSIRKWLKEFAESTRTGKDSGVWLLKSDAPQFDEDELRALVTPELLCQYESMMAEQQRIADAELLLFNPLSSTSNTDTNANTEDIDDSESETATTTAPNKRRTAKLNPQIEELASAAPWNTTANFLTAVNSRISLKLRGIGDPSGRGEAFSFVKAPGEKGISSAATAGTEYRQEITKIWESQMQALSNGSLNSSTTSISTPLTANSLPSSCTLKISRRFGADQWIHEEISDPLVIAAYLKIRPQKSSTNSTSSSNDKKFRRGFMAPTALPLLSASDAMPLSDPRATNAVKRKRPAAGTCENIGKPRKKAVLSTSTSTPFAAVVDKNIQIKCGACGQIGHMRTNRVCPYFDTVPPPLPPSQPPTIIAQNYNLNLKLKIKLTTAGDIGNTANKQNTSISPSDSTDSLYPSPVMIPVTLPRPKGPPIQPLQRIRKIPRKLTPKQLHSQFLTNQTVEVRGKLAELSTFLIAILDALLLLPTTPAFHKPVPKRLYPLYYKIIKSPIDLTTMRAKAVDFQYSSSLNFRNDFELLLENCAQFNGKDSALCDVARDMLTRVDASIEANDEIHTINSFLRSNLHFPDSGFINEDIIVDSADVSILTDPEDEDEEEVAEQEGEHEQEQEQEGETINNEIETTETIIIENTPQYNEEA